MVQYTFQEPAMNYAIQGVAPAAAELRPKGPLEARLTDFSGIEQPKTHGTVAFVGATETGKSHAIQSLLHALGGLGYEQVVADKPDYKPEAEHGVKGRTWFDQNFIYARSSVGQLMPIELISVAGHSKEYTAERMATHNEGIHAHQQAPHRVVAVYDARDAPNSKEGRAQMRAIDNGVQNLIKGLGFSVGDTFLLYTHTDEITDEMRANRFLDFLHNPRLYAANNAPVEPTLDTVNPRLIQLASDMLGSMSPSNTPELLYFGEEPIPETMRDKVIAFDGSGLAIADDRPSGWRHEVSKRLKWLTRSSSV